MTPIWQEIKLANNQYDHLDFYVRNSSNSGDTNQIYRGSIDRMPNGESFIPASEICKNFLYMEVPAFIEEFYYMYPYTPDDPYASGFTVENHAQRYFGFFDANTGVRVAGIDFIYDWSYEITNYYSNNSLCEPINGHADSRMWVLWTFYTNGAKFKVEDIWP